MSIPNDQETSTMSIDQDAADEALVEQTAEATADAAPDSELGEDGHAHHGYMSDKQRYLARLKRIEGQARGIHRMIDEEKYCIDILTQISALNSALRNVGLGLLDDHMRHCVVDAARAGGEEADAKMHEASQAIARLMKG
jgi:DNA-binding FrmR family transcriptional regulator